MAWIPQNSNTPRTAISEEPMSSSGRFLVHPPGRNTAPSLWVGHPGSGMPRFPAGRGAGVKPPLFLLVVRSHQIILGSSQRNIDGKHLANDAELPQLPQPRQRSMDALPTGGARPLRTAPGPSLLCSCQSPNCPSRGAISLSFSFPTPLWAKWPQGPHG